MDTRAKIIDCDRAAALAAELRARGSAMKLVTGYFDVLLAAHVQRLREIAHKPGTLFVLVLDPREPVLGARARAELVAALGMVDYVVPAGERAAQALLGQFTAGEVVREESADLLRARSLSEHVQRRHQP
jgi:bifunctional ADP-heptose synthase (sugar kinase/adenylyltransferase)